MLKFLLSKFRKEVIFKTLLTTLTLSIMAIPGTLAVYLFADMILPQKDNLRKILDTSVKVEIPGIGHGSGTIISSGEIGSYILTNRHVCDAASNISFDGKTYKILNILHKNSRYVGTVVDVATNHDLCLVSVKEGSLPTAKIADADVDVGDPITTIGNPLDRNNFIAKGFAGEMTYLWEMLFRETSLVVMGGQSGSGVYNRDLELVGVVTFAHQLYSSVSGMVSLLDVRAFLKKNGLLSSL